MSVAATRVLDALPGMVWTALPDGSIDFINQRWCEFTNLSASESYGRGWQKAVHPEDLPEVLVRWRSIVASGEAGEMEARLRRFDGLYRWFVFRVSPLADETGRLVKWCSLNTDIEDRRLAEEARALLVGEKRLLELVANGHPTSEVLDAVCRLVERSATGCYCSVVLVNSSGTHLEHGAAPSLPGSFIRAIIGRPVNSDSGPCAMAIHLNEQVVGADLTRETRWADYKWCSMALAHGIQSCWSVPIPSAAGKILGAFALYHREPKTPTSLHRSLIEQLTHIVSIAIERQLWEATLNRARSELARVASANSLGFLTASIAHEVNQPLAGIVTNASTCLLMLDADPPNINGARETARRAIRDGNRASEVITRLRALFSKRDVTKELVDLNEATREVIALSLSELKRNRVIVRTELVDDPPFIEGNRVQIQQVILNLLRNASDAMSAVEGRHRQLLVRSERDIESVRLIVKDTGVGFDRKDAEALFQAFYTTRNGGMGIGLSISRSIIENHHGRLWATPNDGPGATFSFSLPLGRERSTIGNRGARVVANGARTVRELVGTRSAASLLHEASSGPGVVHPELIDSPRPRRRMRYQDGAA